MGCKCGNDKFSEWSGIARNKIKWNPKINYSKCVGCGTCATICKHNVYEWDHKTKRPKVAIPENCVVGCMTCSKMCLQCAISFPDKETLRETIKKEKLLANALKKKVGKRQTDGKK
jgi:NAD-dependent dihydropyrimidine dehydrogenase PreA subunit